MSDEEIKTNSIVVSTIIYDSDSDHEASDNYEDIDETTYSDLEGYESANEETEETKDFLQKHLSDIATLDCIGKNIIKVDFFYPKNINFIDKNDKCDFDINNENIPLLPEGGEDYFLPFMTLLCKKNRKMRGLSFKTNTSKKIFKF